MPYFLTNRYTGADLAQTFLSAADAGIYLDGMGARGESYDITRRDDPAPDARCIRCGDIGADPELGGLCLECDYDTESDYTAPTDHAGTVIHAGARVETLDHADTGTVKHTGNVIDDGTVTVRLDECRGTRNVAPHLLNVIDHTAARPPWIYGPRVPHTASRNEPETRALVRGHGEIPARITDAESALYGRHMGDDIGRA